MQLGAVPYLNAIPLIRGLNHEIRREAPAALARLLKLGEVDLAMAPVTTLFENAKWRAVPRIAIGTAGAAKSVLLCTRSRDVTIENVQSIYLDMESQTSAQLLKVLLASKYGRDLDTIQFISPLPSPAVEAKMIIGDKALREQTAAAWPDGHRYDLGYEWTEWTGLPFVFAAWITPQARIDMSLVEELQMAPARNLKTWQDWLPEIDGYDPALLQEYFTVNMNYGFDEKEQEGLRRFYDYLRELNIYDGPFELKFIEP